MPTSNTNSGALTTRHIAGYALAATIASGVCLAGSGATLAQAEAAAPAGSAQPAAEAPTRTQALETMQRATRFMVDKVAYKGGYVWSYLPDMSRRWGEMEAYPTMIWIQPPGTATMGHVFLDAYHATGDETYYQAAEQVAGALIWGQHPSGGWNYMVDFGGEGSLRHWYDTIGKNGWRLEEFFHYYGNATFDDAGTSEASQFLLRLYVEKRDPRYRPAVEQGPPVRPRQPVPDRRLAAALPAEQGVLAPRQAGLHLVHHAQRRCRRREHQVPDHVLPGARRRRAGARCDHPGDELVPRPAAGPAAAGLGPAIHAGPEARGRAHATSRTR